MWRWGMLLAVFLVVAGCELIGPDFQKPDSETENGWLDRKDGRISQRGSDHRNWWKTFTDPVLDQLIQTAYRQNLSLRESGLRILEARAQLGVAVGDFYPQKQDLSGFTDYIKLPSGALSELLPNKAGGLPPFWWSRMVPGGRCGLKVIRR